MKIRDDFRFLLAFGSILTGILVIALAIQVAVKEARGDVLYPCSYTMSEPCWPPPVDRPAPIDHPNEDTAPDPWDQFVNMIEEMNRQGALLRVLCNEKPWIAGCDRLPKGE